MDWFGDYSAMTRYDGNTRVVLSEFTAKHKNSLRTVAILVQSKIVAMGVSVANLATGGKIEAFSNRDKFESALQKAVARSGTGERHASV